MAALCCFCIVFLLLVSLNCQGRQLSERRADVCAKRFMIGAEWSPELLSWEMLALRTTISTCDLTAAYYYLSPHVIALEMTRLMCYIYSGTSYKNIAAPRQCLNLPQVFTSTMMSSVFECYPALKSQAASRSQKVCRARCKLGRYWNH